MHASRPSVGAARRYGRVAHRGQARARATCQLVRAAGRADSGAGHVVFAARKQLRHAAEGGGFSFIAHPPPLWPLNRTTTFPLHSHSQAEALCLLKRAVARVRTVRVFGHMRDGPSTEWYRKPPRTRTDPDGSEWRMEKEPGGASPAPSLHSRPKPQAPCRRRGTRMGRRATRGALRAATCLPPEPAPVPCAPRR